MNEAAGIAEILAQYGPWAVVAFQFAAIWVMARYIVRMHAEARAEGKEITAALVQTREAMIEQRAQLEKLIDTMVKKLTGE